MDVAEVSLADDRAICEAATPGPWVFDDLNGYIGQERDDDNLNIVADAVLPPDMARGVENGTFIAHFNPAYVARLLDVVEALDDIPVTALGPCANRTLNALAALKAVDDA